MKVGAPIPILAMLASGPAMADAMIVTRAMQAETIAEIFVEPQQVRVELEVGVGDLRAFARALPDEIYRLLELDDASVAERVPAFFAEDWVLRADGTPLQGRLVEAAAQPRVARDEITGEPLAVQPHGATLAVRLVLEYDLTSPPAALTFVPPADPSTGAPAATIGFVLYHRGVAVNDFRYLSAGETVDLDWADPWYSAFRNRNLWRQYSAGAQAFIYVEPCEVRQEIVIRSRDLAPWLDLEHGADDVIRAAAEPELLRAIGDFLRQRNPVTIDGASVEPILDRIHFLRRTLRAGRSDRRDLTGVLRAAGLARAPRTDDDAPRRLRAGRVHRAAAGARARRHDRVLAGDGLRSGRRVPPCACA